MEVKKYINIKNYLGKKLIIVLLIIVLLALGVAAYFYLQFNELKDNPQKFSQEEAQKLVKRVGQLIVLPSDETPTIATVTNADALKSQPFFARAENGDKVLIYTNSKKAILYDQKNNIIVEVAPVSIGGPNQ